MYSGRHPFRCNTKRRQLLLKKPPLFIFATKDCLLCVRHKFLIKTASSFSQWKNEPPAKSVGHLRITETLFLSKLFPLIAYQIQRLALWLTSRSKEFPSSPSEGSIQIFWKGMQMSRSTAERLWSKLRL